MSNGQTFGLWRRFTKKNKLTHIDVNFDVRYEGHQNCPKRLSMDILSVLVTTICNVKININMCERHCVNFFFCEPPP